MGLQSCAVVFVIFFFFGATVASSFKTNWPHVLIVTTKAE